MQYKVPQHVDIEDKVIGSLTIRQFIIILIAAGIILVLNFMLIGPLRMLFFILAFFIGGLALSIAFVKYGDQNLEVFLVSAVKTFTNPRKRVWKKEVAVPNQKAEPVKKTPQEEKGPTDTRIDITSARDNLEKLAEIIDSGGYAALSPEHKANLTPKNVEDAEAADLLAKTEKPDEKVDSIIESATKTTPKREELVSEAASVTPNRLQAETPKLKLRKDQYYKNIK